MDSMIQMLEIAKERTRKLGDGSEEGIQSMNKI